MATMKYIMHLAVVLIVFISSCKKEESPPPPSSSTCSNISHKYSTDVKPIVLNNCAISGCHVSGGGAPGDYTKYSDLAAVAQNGKLRNRVVVKKDMPPSSSGKSLTQDQINIIDCWIADGYPNN